MQSSKIIRLLVLKIFLKVFTIYGHGDHLGYVTYIPQTFVSLPHGCSTCNLALIRQVVLEMFENNGYIHVYSPGAGADNSLGSELLYEPCREKTGFLHMRKQRRRSASR